MSAVTASPRPRPISICGASVQTGDAPGSSPRPARPPATSSEPVAASATVPRTPMRGAANAATGIAETITAASSGSMRHPSTSSSTSRNSAAVSAADSKVRASSAGTCGRPAAAFGAGAVVWRRATSAASAIGACSRKIHSQPASCVSAPPTAGPTAAPATPAAAQERAARASPSRLASSSSAAVTSAAAPTAWMQRAASSTSNDPASPHAADATPKTMMPAGGDRARAPPRHVRGRHGAEREDQVVRREDARDLADLDVEPAQDVGQREGDDRRVGQRRCDGEEEQRATDAIAHVRIFAGISKGGRRPRSSRRARRGSRSSRRRRCAGRG